jgi:hypothetical protein
MTFADASEERARRRWNRFLRPIENMEAGSGIEPLYEDLQSSA